MSRVFSKKDLPAEVVEKILLRLPAKHVVRCKLISKAYSDLIKTPYFVKKHLQHQSAASTNTNIVIAPSVYHYECTDNNHKVLSLLPTPSYVYVPCLPECATFLYVVGSCNGLLCAAVKNIGRTSSLLLWNPVTREHAILPPPHVEHRGLLGMCHATVHYGETSFGLGYDAKNNDFKLVKICRRGHISHVEFWSMKRNSWREVEIQELTATNRDEFGLSVGGSLYWRAHTRMDDDDDVKRTEFFLESFDLVSDRFRSRKFLPDDVVSQYKGGCYAMTIIDFMGSLAYSISYYINDRRNTKNDIWVMDGDNNTWRKQFSIGASPSLRLIHSPGISINGSLLLTKLQPRRYNWYFLYDPRSKEDPKELPSEPVFTEEVKTFYWPWSFIETLASPFVVA